MNSGGPVSDPDRRKFLNGRWSQRVSAGPHPSAEIASILVQARPERLAAAVRAIEVLPGTEIYNRDPRGKLVVVVEASDVGVVGDILNLISSLPDVLTAALVFHGTDAG